MKDTIEELKRLIQEGKRVRLKVSLITEDGVSWLVIRQHYSSCVETGEFLDLLFAGETFKFEKMRGKNEQFERKEKMDV